MKTLLLAGAMMLGALQMNAAEEGKVISLSSSSPPAVSRRVSRETQGGKPRLAGWMAIDSDK